MKLQTSISPRKDGKVNVAGQDGKTYQFAAGEDGELVCDVTDEATVAALLATDNFWPADEADHDEAERLLASALKAAEGSQADDEGDEDEDEDEDTDPADETAPPALPVEANTPPKPAANKPGPKPGAKAAKAAAQAAAK